MHEKRIEIRWSDLDAYGHVYHPVYLGYLEEARDEWLDRLFGLGGRVWDYVVARVAIDYRGELRRDDGAAIARCRVERVGSSSVTTREEVLGPDGRLAAEGEIVLVARDNTSGRSRPLSEDERRALTAAASPD